MDANDLHPPDDYSHRFFIWHEWIQANGPLNADNVFEYFASSMFYDKQSNNQVLRMQTMHTGMPIINEAEELKRFTGVEFAVVHAEPPGFFLIQKRERTSPTSVKPLAVYFIVNNRIYESPDLYSVLSNRLLTSLYSLRTSLNVLSEHKPDHTPRTGFVWPIQDPTLEQDGPDKKRAAEDGPSEAEMSKSLGKRLEGKTRQKNSRLLLNAMYATAARSKLSDTTSGAATSSAPQTAAATPAEVVTSPTSPIAIGPVTPAATSPTEGPAKGVPGGGRKKRKRTGATQPSTTQPSS